LLLVAFMPDFWLQVVAEWAHSSPIQAPCYVVVAAAAAFQQH
jgi:hypothetical protein